MALGPASTVHGTPFANGNKMESLRDINIAGAYTAVTPATPPTGGIALSAAQFGLQYILFAQVMGSDNGAYTGVVYASPFEAKQPTQNLVLQVIVAATGAEATGTIAAGRMLRIRAIGF